MKNKKLNWITLIFLAIVPFASAFEGHYITEPITVAGKLISVYLSADDVEPNGTSITYQVTNNDLYYYKIASGTTLRFSTAVVPDYIYGSSPDPNSGTLRLRIFMSADNNTSPQVNSYNMTYIYTSNRTKTDSKGAFALDDLVVKTVSYNYNVVKKDENATFVAGYTYNLSEFAHVNVGSQSYRSLNMTVYLNNGLEAIGYVNQSNFSRTSTNASVNSEYSFGVTSNGDIVDGLGTIRSNNFTTIGNHSIARFVVYSPIKSQCNGCGNSTANGTVYYQYSVKFNNENRTIDFANIGMPCPSNRNTSWENESQYCKADGLTSNLFVTNLNFSNGSLVRAPANGQFPTFSWAWKTNSSVEKPVTYVTSSWTADNNQSNNETEQYVYSNVTFTNNDAEVNFWNNLVWSIAAPSFGSGVKCLNCSSDNITASINSSVSNTTRLKATAKGNFVNVTKSAKPTGQSIVTGSWEVDKTSTSTLSRQNITQLINGTLTNSIGAITNLLWSATNRTENLIQRGCSVGFTCVNCNGGLTVPAVGSNLTNATAYVDCLNESIGAEIEIGRGISNDICISRYRKDINVTNLDPSIYYTDILANVSVSKRSGNTTLILSCGGVNNTLQFDNTNSTSFRLNSSTMLTDLQSDQLSPGSSVACSIYWDGPGSNPRVIGYVSTVAGSSVTGNVTLKLNESLNITVNLTQAHVASGAYLNSTVQISPVNGDPTDAIPLCTRTNQTSGTGNVSLSCLLNANDTRYRNIEQTYKIVIKSREESLCSNVQQDIPLNYHVVVDTRAPRLTSHNQSTPLPSISSNVTVNATFDDFNVTKVILSYLPNNTVNSSYINTTLSLVNKNVNHTFDLSSLKQLYNTSNGTFVTYFLYAEDSSGNIFKSDQKHFFVACATDHRQLRFRSKGVSLSSGQTITSGTATMEVRDKNNVVVASEKTKIHVEDDGLFSIGLCKDKSTFLIPGEKYKLIVRIEAGSETTYQVEEFVAPPL